MWRIYLTTQILLLVYFTGLIPVQCRKYDIESEALKLYGEDLATVLRIFRRTPEYMDIMNDEIAQLKKNLDDIIRQTIFSYNVRLRKKINQTLTDAEKTDKLPARQSRSRRQGEEQESETMSPVEKLDAHIHSSFTVQDKNFYKDMGYEFVCEAIQSIIESMGPEDETQKSTRFILDNGKDHTIGPHAAKHKINSEERSTKAPNGDDTF